MDNACHFGDFELGLIMEKLRLARRGDDIAEVMENSLYYRGWEVYSSNAYSAKDNPSGCIHMGLADNRLTHDLLEEKLLACESSSLSSFSGYVNQKGLAPFREALASLMTRILKTPFPLSPENLVVSGGASAMVEMMAWCLGDPGDAFIVPAPYYPGFDPDVCSRSGVSIIPAPTGSCEKFDLTLESLEKAWEEGEESGKKVRAVLVTSPSNPLGRTFSEESLRVVLSFCRAKKIHLISDEIYAGSVYSQPEFVSVLNLLDQSDDPSVHVVYGLAKDFGIPGFRLGICYTPNKSLLSALGRISRFYSSSTLTQTLMTQVLSDSNFIDSYLEENNRRLAVRSQLVVDGLKSAGISCQPNNAGLFVWADMRHLLESHDKEGERILFEGLLNEAGINITPSQACHSLEFGWFRICFALEDEATVLVAIQRLKQFAKNRSK